MDTTGASVSASETAQRAGATPGYVLITAARNEQDLIEYPIRSVARQTVLPNKWIIVDDGSSDRTAAVVERCLARHPFLHLIRLRRGGGRSFGNKVRAFNAALQAMRDDRYGYIGNLDADISFAPNYYESVI